MTRLVIVLSWWNFEAYFLESLPCSCIHYRFLGVNWAYDNFFRLRPMTERLLSSVFSTRNILKSMFGSVSTESYRFNQSMLLKKINCIAKKVESWFLIKRSARLVQCEKVANWVQTVVILRKSRKKPLDNFFWRYDKVQVQVIRFIICYISQLVFILLLIFVISFGADKIWNSSGSRN